MNRAQDPESGPAVETERILLLLSRQLDGDLTLEESSELTVVQQTDSLRACFTAMEDLRGQLRALPVKPVPELFGMAVHAALHQQLAAVHPASSPDPRRGWIRRGIVAVSVTACAATLMLFLPTPDVERAVQIAPSNGSPAAEKLMAMSADAAAAIADAAVSGRDATTQPDSVAEPNAIAQPEELRPFLENADWRIVVVRVNSGDREEVLRNIEALVAKNGMDIRSVAGNKHHEARFGVLLTSTAADEHAFLRSVISEAAAQSADLNAQSIADSTRESFISRMQESLKTPTHSELHFGQVYVTVPKSAQPHLEAGHSLLAENAVADNAVAENAGLPPAGAGGNPASAARATAPLAKVAASPPARNTPVLVVFELTTEVTDQI